MENSTKNKIKEVAQNIFYNEIQPNLNSKIFEAKDKTCIIEGIEKGLILAVNQGRKW